MRSLWIEPPEEIERRIRVCLRYVAPERLSVGPDCGFSQTARSAAEQKLANLV